jgi:hypothetical protein
LTLELEHQRTQRARQLGLSDNSSWIAISQAERAARLIEPEVVEPNPNEIGIDQTYNEKIRAARSVGLSDSASIEEIYNADFEKFREFLADQCGLPISATWEQIASNEKHKSIWNRELTTIEETRLGGNQITVEGKYRGIWLKEKFNTKKPRGYIFLEMPAYRAWEIETWTTSRKVMKAFAERYELTLPLIGRIDWSEIYGAKVKQELDEYGLSDRYKRERIIRSVRDMVDAAYFNIDLDDGSALETARNEEYRRLANIPDESKRRAALREKEVRIIGLPADIDQYTLDRLARKQMSMERRLHLAEMEGLPTNALPEESYAHELERARQVFIITHGLDSDVTWDQIDHLIHEYYESTGKNTEPPIIIKKNTKRELKVTQESWANIHNRLEEERLKHIRNLTLGSLNCTWREISIATTEHQRQIAIELGIDEDANEVQIYFADLRKTERIHRAN